VKDNEAGQNRGFVDAIFRAWSQFYDNPVQQKLYYGPIQDAVIARLGETPGRILDLGCGTGKLVEKLPEYALPPFGADISREMLVQAQEKPGLGGRVVVADGHHLPLAANSIDAITCLISFHFYLEPLQALKEMHRVIKPGGKLYMAALTAFFFENETLAQSFKATTQNLFRVYAPSELRGLMEEAGFDTPEHTMVRPFTRLFVAAKAQ
jgi:ubiquinone/menaquinone biosynthesis C-methylase UbiE